MVESVFCVEFPEESPGFLLWQTTTLWQRLMKETLDPYNLSPAQFAILSALCWLEENNKLSNQVALAQLSKLDKMTISKSLKKLIGMKLVSRRESPKDTRAKLVSLTPEGKRLVGKLVPAVEKGDRWFFQALEMSEQRVLRQFLIKLVQEGEGGNFSRVIHTTG